MNHRSLDHALRDALALVRVTSGGDPVLKAEQARKCLARAVHDFPGTPSRALALIAAADEHLEYGELMEARTLLTAARGHLPNRRTAVAARA
ncbi:hypothetical protein SAMN05216553_109133 [Lentzea fradiae]|uniref:Tetratricopeptide repeat-containing protein n=1 Tax=Lentzea fradiae TaxID=200378 RepID=A0A1G7VBJ5_9PSEU|nr:hypothetical protein [Lentzea fradiae]SDG57113.1 hypothetical protein SAMN05216553_109133 [Lentzea fradiae]